jgi:UDP-GlcNAc3NAcA epimerase
VKALSVVGNRPQFIKAAPLTRELEPLCEHVLVHTGQHYDDELSDVFFEELGLRPPDRRIETGPGSHAQQTAAMLLGLEPLLERERPDAVIVYGDTNSTLGGALAAAKAPRPLAHVEAGLRSFDRSMPEEVNRVVADALSQLLLCPSETAVRNLAAEGRSQGVHLVGDVMVDAAALFGPLAERRSEVARRHGLRPGGYALATVHREANTRPQALPRVLEVLEAVPLPVALPLHPRTRTALERERLLERAARAALLLPPLGYLDFTALLVQAAACITDSGGVQKEAYLHRVPCLTLRETSEWPETVELGWNRLVGLSPQATAEALAAPAQPRAHPPLYGDGHAAARMAQLIVSLP